MTERKKQEAWRKKSQQGGKRSAKSRTLKNKDQSRVVEGSLKGGSSLVEPQGNSSSSSSLKKKEEEEGASPLSSVEMEDCSVAEVLTGWNAIPGVPIVAAKHLSVGRGIHRRITTLTRMHQPDAHSWWTNVFDAVRAQQHFLFSGDNSRQWTANLAWVLGPENLAKVLERRYGEYRPGHTNSLHSLSLVSLPGSGRPSRERIPL
jgi:hypothetical protein